MIIQYYTAQRFSNSDILFPDDTRSKDVGAMLSFDRGHATRLNLTPYQWLDVCIALCKIVIDIHEHGALSNDISLYNILIR